MTQFYAFAFKEVRDSLSPFRIIEENAVDVAALLDHIDIGNGRSLVPRWAKQLRMFNYLR